MARKWLTQERKPVNKSRQQENRIAKILSGKTTINSGATFGENDVITKTCEVEAKTTSKKSYTLHTEDLLKMQDKCKTNKIPVFVITFEPLEEDYAVIKFSDLQMLLAEFAGLK